MTWSEDMLASRAMKIMMSISNMTYITILSTRNAIRSFFNKLLSPFFNNRYTSSTLLYFEKD